MNSAVRNIHGRYKLVSVIVHIPRSGIAGSQVMHVFSFSRYCIFQKVIYLFTFPQKFMRISVVLYFHQHSILSDPFILAFLLSVFVNLYLIVFLFPIGSLVLLFS